MFERNENKEGFNPETVKFIICYDKFTKPMALSLRNSIGKEANCTIWNKKHYLDNEVKLTNHNYLLLLDPEMIKENLANPSLKPSTFSPNVLIKCEGNTFGIYIDPQAELPTFKEAFKQSWLKYVLSIILPILTVGGLPLATFLGWNIFRISKNKVKYRLLFDAVNKIDMSTLKKYFNVENFD